MKRINSEIALFILMLAVLAWSLCATTHPCQNLPETRQNIAYECLGPDTWPVIMKSPKRNLKCKK